MVTRSIRRTKNTLFNRGFINFNNKFNNKLIKDRTSLNRMKWNKDGTKILVGDALGKISIYETDKNVIYIF